MDTFTFFSIANTMERLDEGHLHPKLEVPRLTYFGQESNLGLTVRSEHSSKELFEQRVNSFSEHLHMSPRDSSPLCMWYMNIYEHHEMHDVGRRALASRY
jgi:hypothetical protein